jgi:hypothetical protein
MDRSSHHLNMYRIFWGDPRSSPNQVCPMMRPRVETATLPHIQPLSTYRNYRSLVIIRRTALPLFSNCTHTAPDTTINAHSCAVGNSMTLAPGEKMQAGHGGLCQPFESGTNLVSETTNHLHPLHLFVFRSLSYTRRDNQLDLKGSRFRRWRQKRLRGLEERCVRIFC